MDANGHRRVINLAWFSVLLLLTAANAQEQRSAPSSQVSRAEREEFLLKANIVSESAPSSGARQPVRVGLDDGKRKHAAAVETSTSPDLSQRDYRFNIAAYELDKALELNLVVPSVERRVNGKPAALTWWVDDVLMSELDRRAKKIEPPDPETWGQQMQAVHVFDELVANAYRNVHPAFYSSTIWDNLLITRNWQIWLIDHTRTFGTSHQLGNPESLTQCDRTVLSKLRELNKDGLKQRLGKFLASAQLDALEARRMLIVKHFDELLARNGERAVLYDLPPRL